MTPEDMDTIVCALISLGTIVVYALWDIYRRR